ncbi:DUF554 domain-containing protein [Caviibacter abscessus]|uniref:DUF554 domain-containing protein n=1 Tax=Caviibacter abscessus TaxID=1766719 RepID=UPI0008370D6F|nr:DUF554 domain-containing protein [Caviibacter abscessus]
MGVLVNAFTVLIAALIGIFLGEKISERIKKILIKILGIVIVIFGFKTLIHIDNYKRAIIYIIISFLLGTVLKLDDNLVKFSNKLELLLSHKTGEKFAKGLVFTTMLTCIGAMAILGSFSEALYNDRSIVYAKSLLDSVMAVIAGSVYGIGVAFTSIFILIYQGFFYLFALNIKPYLTAIAISDITTVGGIFLILLGINTIFNTKIKIFNMILALFLPIIMEVIKI